MLRHLTVAAVLVALAAAFSTTAGESGIVNVDVTVHMDLVGHIVREQVLIAFKNTGMGTVHQYTAFMPKDLHQYVARITTRQNETGRTELLINEDYADDPSLVQYIVSLSSPVLPGEVAGLSFRISMTGTNRILVALPAEVTQSETQKMVFKGCIYGLIFPYESELVKPILFISSDEVDSYTNDVKVVKEGRMIKYGPFKNLKPMSQKSLYLHYSNERPFQLAPRIVRTLDLSHWGTLRVAEQHTLRHSGAKLRGGFSRLDYAAGRPKKSFLTLQATLPEQVHSIFYRDAVGNVSSTMVQHSPAVTEGRGQKPAEYYVFLHQRYPLMGGWETAFEWGYKEDLQYSVNGTANAFSFTTTFMPPIWGLHIMDLRLRVILPETAVVTKVWKGKHRIFNYTILLEPTLFSWTGQTVVELGMRDVATPDFTDKLTVEYTLERPAVCIKAFSVSAAVFVLLMSFSITSRFL